MRYYGDEALGLVETIGMVPAIAAVDTMLKAADVELISYENVGSSFVTIMVKGDVGAVRASVEAGSEAAAAIGKLRARNVMPRPIKSVGDIVSVHDIDSYKPPESKEQPGKRYEALGLVEIIGLVFVLEAADAMCKAAGVDLVGYENVGTGYISILVRGDVGACKTAVDAGIRAVKGMDADVYSSIVIARPHPDIEKIIGRYSLENLLS